MPVNIDAIANWLKGTGFPCGRAELVRAARDKGAGDEVIFLLEQLPDKTLDSQTEVNLILSQIIQQQTDTGPT